MICGCVLISVNVPPYRFLYPLSPSVPSFTLSILINALTLTSHIQFPSSLSPSFCSGAFLVTGFTPSGLGTEKSVLSTVIVVVVTVWLVLYSVTTTHKSLPVLYIKQRKVEIKIIFLYG
ncbi:hypothetical protein O2K51_04045 [Apibacter raozihei]|uniref:hypothetical protein n=1 Tax=Apibacter raozihei TaxID=2500547 RepID=UPI000FE3206D|nr:hypothetical protein [Apibacter raozihei]